MESKKAPPTRKPPPGGSGVQQSMMGRNGSVTVSVTRKHSVRQYETADVSISVTTETSPHETQSEATQRIYEQLKEDLVPMSQEILKMAKAREL